MPCQKNLVWSDLYHEKDKEGLKVLCVNYHIRSKQVAGTSLVKLQFKERPNAKTHPKSNLCAWTAQFLYWLLPRQPKNS